MKKIFLTLIFAFVFLSVKSFGQCKEYIRTVAPEEIKPYIIDPNFFAPIMQEGERIDFQRTFLKGNRYIIKVIGVPFLAKTIIIRDENGNVIFANQNLKKFNVEDKYFTDYEGNQIPWQGSNYFEFDCDSSQNLTITVILEKKSKKKKDRLRGCLGVVIGFLPIVEDVPKR